MRLVIWGAPRTKKTHNMLARAGGRMIVLPSKAWTRWVKTARLEYTFPHPGFPCEITPRPFATPIAVRALFFRDANRGDLVGYMQGLADLLEQRQILTNDRLIESWDGTRLLLDRERPRVELHITPVEPDAAVHAPQDAPASSTGGQP